MLFYAQPSALLHHNNLVSVLWCCGACEVCGAWFFVAVCCKCSGESGFGIDVLVVCLALGEGVAVSESDFGVGCGCGSELAALGAGLTDWQEALVGLGLVAIGWFVGSLLRHLLYKRPVSSVMNASLERHLAK